MEKPRTLSKWDIRLIVLAARLRMEKRFAVAAAKTEILPPRL